MQKHIYSTVFASLLLTGFCQPLLAQRVGVLTPNPQAPFHVASSGQVNTPGGLAVLGDTSEAHLEIDFNLLQSKFGSGPLRLDLQPQGGDLRVGESLLHLNATTGFLGIGTITPGRKLDVVGTGNQFARVHTTSVGSSIAGLELIRSSAFSGTDWRILNEGGTLRIYDGLDNFATDGDLNFTMTSSGNLGLGIDPPEAHLHVAGNTDQFVKIHRTTAGTGMAGIDLLRDNEFSATDWRIVNDGGVLEFRDAINNFTGASDLNMVMTQGGFVGIGTDAPHANLHVNGSEAVSETGDGYMQVGNGTGLHLRFDNNEILARNGDNPSTLFFQFWSGNLSLASNDDGRVAIGHSSPQAKLHVTDGTDVNLAGGGELVLGPTSGANLAMDGNEIQARNNGAASALFIHADGGDVLLVANETGQVGIGVSSSANMPSNDYLLAVDGKIISEEVRVELSGSWPDYVFHPDYALTPLAQLEESISALGHLPGIPSAAQVESEGILLGDMQRAMMEKIEELTLYMIAANKEIEALKKANTSLEARMMQLHN